MGLYEYEYNFNPVAGTTIGGIAGLLLGVLVVFYLLLLLFGIVCYVLQSLGMYTIAKRRGIHNPWLAWLPVGNMWILGSISDQYQYVVKGRVRNRRKVMMFLTAAMLVCGWPIWFVVAAMSAGSVEVMLIVSAMIALTALAIGIVAIVVEFLALFDLYKSCDPGNSVLYLVLSILFSVLMPLFVFVCRKKDLGMPPRKAKEPVVSVELPASEAPVEETAVEEEPADAAVEENPVEE